MLLNFLAIIGVEGGSIFWAKRLIEFKGLRNLETESDHRGYEFNDKMMKIGIYLKS